MAASTEVKVLSKPKKVAKSVAREIKKLILKSNQQPFHIALSGGNTPRKLFKKLAKKYRDSIPWEYVHFWWGDERCVKPTSDLSNFRMANENLFLKIPIPAKNINRIRGERNPENEAERYSDDLIEHLEIRNGFPVFDIILLGLGDDGHTASIFPENLELFHSKKVCAVTVQPGSGQKRITLTGDVINNAKSIFFMVTGEKKAKRLSEIMNNEEVAKKHPAYYVEAQTGSVTWFVDEPAASKFS